MSFSITEDIRSITDLKRHTREVLDQIHQTGRPVILTVNGKADAVILDAKVFEKYLHENNFAKAIAKGEEDIQKKRLQPARKFLEEFKNNHGI